jgi:phosphopantothenoylcysteine decarboxylase/phosphopantothenate--cysteine ligase
LVQNPDVLADLVQRRSDPAQVLVGFAAETAASPDELLELGRSKLERKGCDLLVLNNVGGGKVFGRTESEIRLLTASGGAGGADPEPLTGGKGTLAHHIWDAVARIRAAR